MENFLPEHQPVVENGRLRCKKRLKDVKATPEEIVRQRILHWLFDTTNWDRSTVCLERSYQWQSDPTRRRIRPDIELLSDDGNVTVVVECKAPEIPLSENVDRQAKEYALKSGAKYIWVTNGDTHKFLKKNAKGRWKAVETLKPLAVLCNPPAIHIAFPNVADEADVLRYFDELEPQFENFADSHERDFVLAIHRVLFDLRRKLPYSHDGVHVLEDRGTAFHSFGNRSGGTYYGRYRDFMAATEGRVEACSVAANLSVTDRGNERIALCVGVSKPDRKHHALQLIYDTNCEYHENEQFWDVYHDGRIPQGAGTAIG